MKLPHLILREIAFRKISFAASLLAVCASACCVVASFELLKDHDLRTEEILKEKSLQETGRLKKYTLRLTELTRKHEDETRKTMKNLGFNILILPRDQNLADLYAEDFASKYMPEEYVKRLANSKIVTVNHLLPSLTQKLTWPEKKRTVILIGVRGEVPLMHKDPKKPLLDAVPKGTVVLGYELHQSLGLKEGDRITLMGEEFKVHKCYKARGNKDDISVWVDLSKAQRMLKKEGKINAILALECNCTADRLPIIRKEIADILPETQVIERGTKATARAEQRMAARRLAEDTLATEKKRAAETLAASREERGYHKAELESFTATLIPLVLAGCALLIGLLAFLNVRERQAEIGILRAIGLKSSQVYAIFLVKAVFIGVVGSLAGLPLGHLIASQAAKSSAAAQGELLATGGNLFLLVLVTTPLVTLLSSWVPTLIAVQQDPSSTLRET
tara:strand:- start:279 stop:1622 length:1344 start_codon:yes stop_codon:yes gene_type:complete